MSKSPASLPPTGALWAISTYQVTYVVSPLGVLMLKSSKAPRLEALTLVRQAQDEDLACEALYQPAPNLPEINGHFLLLGLQHSHRERAAEDQAIVFVSERGEVYSHAESVGLTGSSTIAHFETLREDAIHRARIARNLLKPFPAPEYQPELPSDCQA